MYLYNLSVLEKNHTDYINELISACEKYDGVRPCVFMENPSANPTETALSESLPSFYFACPEKGERPVGFMSLFIPNDDECEIYCCVHPSYRRKNIFMRLFEYAKGYIEKSGIKNIYFVTRPGQAAEAACASFYVSEYMLINDNLGMKTNRSDLSSSCPLILSHEHTLPQDSDFENLSFIHPGSYSIPKNTPIGKCSLLYSGSCATILGFEILAPYRRCGFGKKSLRLVLDYLAQKNIAAALLHVTGKNKAACHLYMTNGFSVKEQIDYYLLPLF